VHLRKRKPIGATWLGQPFLTKVNGGRFSIHQQVAAPFEIVHYVTATGRSKLALVLRHQTVQAVQFFAYLLPRGVMGVTTWHSPLIVQTAARLGELSQMTRASFTKVRSAYGEYNTCEHQRIESQGLPAPSRRLSPCPDAAASNRSNVLITCRY
jgi:hypothetical protein